MDELVERVTEEKAIETALADSADDLFYLNVFKEAKEAFWQREGGAISECDTQCISVLKRHFVPRAIIHLVQADQRERDAAIADKSVKWDGTDNCCSATAEAIATAIRNQEPTDGR